MSERLLNQMDRLIVGLDKALTTLVGKPETTFRSVPGSLISEPELTEQERRHTAGLMRVNHAGEVSAQGLYQGQALTAKLADVRAAMELAAKEENDHLLWCQTRLEALSSRRSVLNPVWYFGSFTIGALAGLAGDKWSLGFVAETEKQVVIHINRHLAQMTEKDQKSRAVLEQMKIDEAHHGETALLSGGVELPKPLTKVMGKVSKLMTLSSYWI